MIRTIIAFFVFTCFCHAQEERIVFRDGTMVPVSFSKTSNIPLEIEKLPDAAFAKGPLSVALNQDGNYLATGSADGAVKLWSLGETGFKESLEIRSTKGSTEPVHPAGTILVDLHPNAPAAGVVASIGQYDNKLGRIFWIFPRGEQKFNESTPAAEMRTMVGSPLGFAFSPDAQFEAQFDSLRVFVTRKLNRNGLSTEEREKLRQVWSYDVAAKGIAWTGDTLAILSEANIIGWKPGIEATKPRYLFPANKVSAIAGSANFLVTLGQEQKARLYNLQKQLSAEFENSAVLACFSPDEKLLFTVSQNGEITIWDLQSGLAFNKLLLKKAVTSIDCGMNQAANEEAKYVLVAGTSTGELHTFRVFKK